MSAAWGSSYVDDFIDKGRVKKVYIQGDSDARISEEDFAKWYVRNSADQMVPFSSFATGKWAYGSPTLERYNGMPAVEILGSPAAGDSSGDEDRKRVVQGQSGSGRVDMGGRSPLKTKQ